MTVTHTHIDVAKMTPGSLAAIQDGWPLEMGRYDQELCSQDPQAIWLSGILANGASHNPPDWAAGILKARVMELYGEMERHLRIEQCSHDHEPYKTSEEMQEDAARGHFWVKERKLGPVVGHLVEQWRAVHDYWGHVKGRAPFTLRGEISAFALHAQQFPRVCLPFIFSNVVLENAYRLTHGHFFCITRQCGSLVVFAEDYFGAPETFYRTREW